ncbi:MAG: sodium:proton antiporter [Candidatus Eremiobacteraeota bacterium]|nr:sodium:proton antiporter [Candidatus Eremiobacteraeota bacterium]MBC5822376.1 sodium:proton antiporter [Candidatus Eremiobacteraeota bacterium]
MQPGLTETVAFTIGVLAVALPIGIVAERLRIPYAVALVLVALTITRAPSAPSASFSSIVLLVILPALVFEAAWNLDLKILRHVAVPIAFLAVPGVLVTAVLVGGGLALSGQLPFTEAALLGAILAATDPIAVIATFRRLAVPAPLATLIEGESLFNDGAAVVLYGVLVAAATPASHGVTLLPGPIVLRAIEESLGGIALGLVTAVALTIGLRGTKESMLQIVATLVGAYGAYLVANELLHVSGIFAAVVVGLALRAFPHFPTTAEDTTEIDRFWTVLAFLANSLVFLLLGLRIEVGRIVHEPWLVLTTLGLVVLARLILTYVGLPLVGFGGRRYRGWQHVTAIAGMRGALSLALAIALPSTVPQRALIIDAVFGVVLVTLVVQGLAIGPVLKRLHL